MKKTLLITWWLGYIGSHAVVIFEQAWYECIVVDNLANTTIKVKDHIESILEKPITFYQKDIRDKQALDEIFSKHNISWVIHFAGLKAVGESMQDPYIYYDVNVSWSQNIFEVMHKYNVKNIIFSSSCTVYEVTSPPINEDSKLGCSNPYGYSKLIVEHMLQWLAISNNINAISLRYFNPIGAHPSGKIWETPNWVPNNLLPYVLDVASWKREEVYIFGDDYKTKDGTGVRDYIHVMDLVEGHLNAYNYMLDQQAKQEGGFFDAINLWTGEWTSVKELVGSAQKVIQKDIPYKITPRRAWDIAEVYCNPSKAKQVLWWEAKKTVEEGIRDSWRFVQESLLSQKEHD